MAAEDYDNEECKESFGAFDAIAAIPQVTTTNDADLELN